MRGWAVLVVGLASRTRAEMQGWQREGRECILDGREGESGASCAVVKEEAGGAQGEGPMEAAGQAGDGR